MAGILAIIGAVLQVVLLLLQSHFSKEADAKAAIAKLRAELQASRSECYGHEKRFERLQSDLLKAGLKLEASRLECERMRVDAERYCALRGSLHPDIISHTQMPMVCVPLRTDIGYTKDGLDAAIDSTMKKDRT